MELGLLLSGHSRCLTRFTECQRRMSLLCISHVFAVLLVHAWQADAFLASRKNSGWLAITGLQYLPRPNGISTAADRQISQSPILMVLRHWCRWSLRFEVNRKVLRKPAERLSADSTRAANTHGKHASRYILSECMWEFLKIRGPKKSSKKVELSLEGHPPKKTLDFPKQPFLFLGPTYVDRCGFGQEQVC